MTYLFDTNVVSELRVQRRADPAVWAWAASIPAESVFISAITLLELERGVRSMERRDASVGEILRQWMAAHVLPRYLERTLSVDATVALKCAELAIPSPKHQADALIAATALVNGLILVTRNVKHMEQTGVRLLNPWDS